MDPIKICIGYDHRQTISYSCLAHSIVRHASVPVAIMPLVLPTLPLPEDCVGLTPFTFTRYLTPWLCGFKGKAIFMDSDVVVRGDVKGLMEAATGDHALWVVKHERAFEWPSVMVFDCEHNANRVLTPEYVAQARKSLAGFNWLEPEMVGDLPHEWNHLVLYDEPNPDAKLIHYTAGIPIWPETQGCEHTEAWQEEWQSAAGAISWSDLMGRSVHIPVVRDHLIASGKLKVGARDDGSVAP